jgi:hypothetical protein
MKALEKFNQKVKQYAQKEKIRIMMTYSPSYADFLLHMEAIDGYLFKEESGYHDWNAFVKYKEKLYKFIEREDEGFWEECIDHASSLNKEETKHFSCVLKELGFTDYFPEIKKEKNETCFQRNQKEHKEIKIVDIEQIPDELSYLLYTLENGKK